MPSLEGKVIVHEWPEATHGRWMIEGGFYGEPVEFHGEWTVSEYQDEIEIAVTDCNEGSNSVFISAEVLEKINQLRAKYPPRKDA